MIATVYPDGINRLDNYFTEECDGIDIDRLKGNLIISWYQSVMREISQIILDGFCGFSLGLLPRTEEAKYCYGFID